MSVQVTPAQMDTLKSTLLNTTGSTPLHERFRALFMLKAVNNDEVVKIVAEGKPPCPLDYYASASGLEGIELTLRIGRPISITQTRTSICPRSTPKPLSYPNPRRRPNQPNWETLFNGPT
jgi:hypothetical protein